MAPLSLANSAFRNAADLSSGGACGAAASRAAAVRVSSMRMGVPPERACEGTAFGLPGGRPPRNEKAMAPAARGRRCSVGAALLWGSPGGREYPLFKKGFADLDGLRVVHRQDRDRHAPDGGPADQVGTVPAEMTLPSVAPRIEQLGQPLRAGVQPGAIRPLMAVAVQAGESQVAQRRRTPVLPGDDVVDGERDRGVIRLRHAAVFAGAVGP